jgi:hypothetical protein
MDPILSRYYLVPKSVPELSIQCRNIALIVISGEVGIQYKTHTRDGEKDTGDG